MKFAMFRHPFTQDRDLVPKLANIQDGKLIVLVMRVGNQREVYR
jgi:hypothetical protein